MILMQQWSMLSSARIDQDVENERRSMQHSFDKDVTLDKIRGNISQNLIERGLFKDRKEFFLISNRYLAEYQFDELTQAIFCRNDNERLLC